MVDLHLLFDTLDSLGIDFYTGVPDSLLNDFCNYLSDNIPDGRHVMAANEGNAVAIAAGHYLATGRIPLVYMQNSGIGNATNPLLSLAHDCVYGIPMVLVIGWRGDPSGTDHAQHRKQGELTPVLMNDMDIPFEILDSDETVLEKFRWAADKARTVSSPVALIVKKAILAQKEKKQDYPASDLMNREEAISAVLDIIGQDAIYLATTGRTTRELHENLKMRGWADSGREFLNVGAMGHLSSVGLGIALAKPDKKVVIFDGDAAAVMHMGSLATNCRYPAPNLLHIVLNNGVNESVGGQKSAGRVVNMTGVAAACGYHTPGNALKTKKEVAGFLQVPSNSMPRFIDLYVRQGIRHDMPKLNINHKCQRDALMENLG